MGLSVPIRTAPILPEADASVTVTTTRFTRPTLDVATVDAKAACLYPNNARMMREAVSKGFNNAIVTDAMARFSHRFPMVLFSMALHGNAS